MIHCISEYTDEDEFDEDVETVHKTIVFTPRNDHKAVNCEIRFSEKLR